LIEGVKSGKNEPQRLGYNPNSYIFKFYIPAKWMVMVFNAYDLGRLLGNRSQVHNQIRFIYYYY